MDDRRRDARTASRPADRAGEPALRDADAILARARADEESAADARERYRQSPMAPLEPDPRIARLLATGERLLAVRRSAVIDRRVPPVDRRWSRGPGLSGDLYLTSARLLHIGRLTLEFDIASVQDAVVAGERLLLRLADGTALTIEVDGPRLLRVEIGAARSSMLAGSPAPDARAGAARFG